jgi:hypothetical protein
MTVTPSKTGVRVGNQTFEPDYDYIPTTMAGFRLVKLTKSKRSTRKLYKKISQPVINKEFFDGSNCTNSQDAMQLGREQLAEIGMHPHFKSLVGGCRSDRAVVILEKNLLEYLFWTFMQIHNMTLDPFQVNLVHWLREVVQHHYDILPDYSLYLETVKGFQGGTIINIMYNIVSVVKWLVHFKPIKNDDDSPLHINTDAFEFVLKAVTKHNRRKRKASMNSFDMEEAVSSRRFPKNGLPTLIRCVANDIAIFENHFTSRDVVNKAMFDEYVSLLYSALYVLSAQGRVGGLQSLQLKHADKLLEQGFVLSKSFKTKGSWLYQPVTISKQSGKLLRYYVTKLRPQVCNVVSQNDPLWVNWYGNAELDIGSLVTKYFRKHLDLHITTTTIRSLVETQAQELFEQGVITQADRESISNINGHSSRIARMYYVERDRVKDVCNTRNLFRHIVATEDNAPDSCFNAVEFGGVEWPKQAIHDYCNWGVQHPDYTKNTKRAKWSRAELEYICDWMKGRLLTKVKHGNLQTVSALWYYITRGPGKEQAQLIFHSNHILDSARLRHGYRIVCGDRSIKRCDDDSE